MRCSWLRRLLGRRSLPRISGLLVVVVGRPLLSAARRIIALPAAVCRGRLGVPVAGAGCRLGGAASLGLFFEPGGRPRLFAAARLLSAVGAVLASFDSYQFRA